MHYTRWRPNYLVWWLFDQDRIWITAAGEEKLIAQMDSEHAFNAVLMLERVRFDIEPLLRGGIAVSATPLYAALKARAQHPQRPEGAKYAVTKDEVTYFLAERPRFAVDRCWSQSFKRFPYEAHGWDCQAEGSPAAVIIMTKDEAKTVRPV